MSNLYPDLLDRLRRNGLRHSDPEKTILDFIYVWRYNGIPEDKIAADVSEWSKGVSKNQGCEVCGKLSDHCVQDREKSS